MKKLLTDSQAGEINGIGEALYEVAKGLAPGVGSVNDPAAVATILGKAYALSLAAAAGPGGKSRVPGAVEAAHTLLTRVVPKEWDTMFKATLDD